MLDEKKFLKTASWEIELADGFRRTFFDRKTLAGFINSRAPLEISGIEIKEIDLYQTLFCESDRLADAARNLMAIADEHALSPLKAMSDKIDEIRGELWELYLQE